MTSRFSLRLLLFTIAVLAGIFAVIRIVISRAGSIYVVAAPDDCVVYLDDVPLGAGRFTISADRAMELGLPLYGRLRHRDRPQGIYLPDLADTEGHIPLLHLRPLSGARGNVRILNMESNPERPVVKIQRGSIEGRHVLLEAAPTLEEPAFENVVTCVSERSHGKTRTYTLRVKLSPELKRVFEPYKLIRFSLNSFSLDNGNYTPIGELNLAVSDDLGEKLVECEVPLNVRDERFYLYFLINATGVKTIPNNSSPFGKAFVIRNQEQIIPKGEQEVSDRNGT